MLKLSELLTLKERKLLTRLSLTILVVLAILVSFLFFWSSKLNGVRHEANKVQAELGKISAQTEQVKTELLRWQTTAKDLEELKKNAFYSGQQGLESFRDDLKKLLQQTGLPLPGVSYQYEESEKKEFRKLSASFSLRLSYPLLKRFLYQLETWPRLLVLDQINFQKIDNLSGVLDLRLTVSGFYHEEK